MPVYSARCKRGAKKLKDAKTAERSCTRQNEIVIGFLCDETSQRNVWKPQPLLIQGSSERPRRVQYAANQCYLITERCSWQEAFDAYSSGYSLYALLYNSAEEHSFGDTTQQHETYEIIFTELNSEMTSDKNG